MKLSNAIKSAVPAAILGILALGITPMAGASTVTSNMAVTASVQATCIVNAAAMAFGTYVSTAASTSTANITVTCTNSTTYTLGLDAGATSGASVTTRQMKNGAAVLNYALFSDAGHTTNWGNTTGSWVSGIGNGAGQAIPVYGQAAAGQYVTPGAYSDSITATVTY